MMFRRSLPRLNSEISEFGWSADGLQPSWSHDSQRPLSGIQHFVVRRLGLGALRFLAVPLLWLQRARYRHELSQISERQLRDVGLNPAVIRRESAKPFWQA
jgi:uncharacterized protein YjiS (DUF1127 family)